MITVITVCYNAVDVIEGTMVSVLNQTYNDIEYIIIDGLSTDNTLAIINKVASLYPTKNIKIISEKDKGIYDAMNKAIKLAHGEWLNFMNAGDVFSKDTILEDIVNSGLMNQYDFIYSDFIARDGKKQRFIPQDYDRGKVLHQSLIYKKILHDQYGQYVVTHPYIISDYLFFVQVNKKQVAKFKEPISINDTTGISMQGNWINYQRLCVDYMMRRIGVSELTKGILERIFIDLIKRIIRR